jgi:hypothetical protein
MGVQDLFPLPLKNGCPGLPYFHPGPSSILPGLPGPENGCPGFIQDFCPNSAMKNGCPGFQQQAYVQDFIQDLGKLSRAEKMGVQDLFRIFVLTVP